VLASAAKKIVSQFGAPKVFFLDRVSRGALILAKACAELGALIFFEPSGFGEPRLFKEAYAMAHVLKYSHERVRSSHGIANSGPFLEIETLGAEGLRYRSKIKGARSNGWEQLEAYEILDLKDTAGAGDWCSAGIIHKLAQKGLNGLLQTRKSQLQEAFRFGQALATWNCSYEGARGGMYAVDKRTFRRQVQGIMSRNGAKVLKREIPTPTVRKIFERICPNCTPDPCSKRKTNR
jgi:fructokinase